ncbi:MAG: BON domain-containing protein [Gemmatimonas sp.]|nr:BON domain-containing protein [Gemmatimonas sp.]
MIHFDDGSHRRPTRRGGAEVRNESDHHGETMRNQANLMLGVLFGAGLMYLLDPDRGRRRRALVRDQAVHGGHEVEDIGDGVASKARHLRNRARGAMLEVKNRLARELETNDSVLEARVRSHLGRLVSDPTSVEVSAEHGRVTLRGAAPDQEMRGLIEGVQEVPGVHDVISRLRRQRSKG